MKEYLEFEAKTIDEAIEKACSEFNVPRGKLNVEIITEGSGGFLGILGAKKAKIKASLMSVTMDFDEPFHDTLPVHEPPPRSEAQPRDISDDGDTAFQSKEIVEGILERMGFPFPVVATEMDEYVTLEIKGDGSGLLIGKGGQTLDALQYIVNKALNKNGKERKRVILDTENYRAKREKSLVTLARKLGEKAKRIKKPVTVNPMNAHDRRIVHLALQDDKDLLTKSKGEGTFRKIIIVPHKKG